MKKYNSEEVDQNLHMANDGFCWLIVTEKAKELYSTSLFDLYEVREKKNKDIESLIESFEDLNKCLENGAMIGIEVGHSDKKWADWYNDGNVEKVGEDEYLEQSTQWNRAFSMVELKHYYLTQLH